MNNYKLIKLEQGYIIVSDDDIKSEEKKHYYIFYNSPFQHERGIYEVNEILDEDVLVVYTTNKDAFPGEYCVKIIASTFIRKLPDIDFNNLGEEFGIFDVNKLASSEIPTNILQTSKGCFDDLNEYERDVWKNGFNKCLELNKDKLYTKDQLLKAIEMARDITDGKDTFTAEDISGCTEVCTYNWKDKYDNETIIKSLQLKSEWDIEVFIEENKVKINKIL